MINTTVFFATMLTGVLADFIILHDFRMRRRLFLIIQWLSISVAIGIMTPAEATSPVVWFALITAVGRLAGFAAWTSTEYLRVRQAIQRVNRRRGEI